MFVVASKSNPNLETHINPTLTLALCGPYLTLALMLTCQFWYCGRCPGRMFAVMKLNIVLSGTGRYS